VDVADLGVALQASATLPARGRGLQKGDFANDRSAPPSSSEPLSLSSAQASSLWAHLGEDVDGDEDEDEDEEEEEEDDNDDEEDEADDDR
jgi:hypothetical protein